MISKISERKENNDNVTPRYVINLLAIFCIIILCKHTVKQFFTPKTHCNVERFRDARPPIVTTTTDGADSQKTTIEGAEIKRNNKNKDSACHGSSLNNFSQRRSFTDHATKGCNRCLPERIYLQSFQSFRVLSSHSTTLAGEFFSKRLKLNLVYCVSSNPNRKVMESDPIMNIQTLFRRRNYDVPMLVATRNDADDLVHPVFNMDVYAEWNENQIVPKYSRVVGKAILAKILESQPFEPAWFKDEVLRVIRTALEEDIEEKQEVVDELSIFSWERPNLMNKIRIMTNALNEIKHQLNTDKTLETYRYVKLPGNTVMFNALTKSFHWKFVNCFHVSTRMNSLDHKVVEESINRHILQNVRNNEFWLRNVLNYGRGFFVDGADTRRAIVLKNTDDPDERVMAHDLANAITHYEPVDLDAIRPGPTTRSSHLSRGYEHQALPENFEDEESDPDPEDLDVCSRIDGEDVLACLNQTCRLDCELCRENALTARYYIDNEVSTTPRAQRHEIRYRLDVRTSSSSSANSDTSNPQIDHEVAYNLTQANQPTRPPTTELLTGYTIPDLPYTHETPRADDVPPDTLSGYVDPRLIPGAVHDAFRFEDLPPITEAGPPTGRRNEKIVGYLRGPCSEDPEKHGGLDDSYEMNEKERRERGLRRGHDEVRVGAIHLGEVLDYIRMRSDTLYADTIGEVYTPRKVIAQSLAEGTTNVVTRRYPFWTNRVRTRAHERRSSFRSAQWEMLRFCYERELSETTTDSSSESKSDEKSETKIQNDCSICEMSDNGGNDLKDNHICNLRKERKKFSIDNEIVVQPPRERPYDSSGEDHTGAEPKLKAELKKKRDELKRKLGLKNYIGPNDYDADDERETNASKKKHKRCRICKKQFLDEEALQSHLVQAHMIPMSGPTEDCHICDESVPKDKLKRHILGAHIIPKGGDEQGEHDQPLLPLELNPTMLPTERPTNQSADLLTEEDQPVSRQSLRRNEGDDARHSFETVFIHRNTNELIQQWEQRIEEATNLDDESHVINWNGSTMVWNHRDVQNEVVFLYVEPTECELTQQDIEHTVKHDGREHVAEVGRGDPDLEELILKYFNVVQTQLSKRLNKLRADVQAQEDEGRRYDLRETHSDQETSELFERVRNRKDQEPHQG